MSRICFDRPPRAAPPPELAPDDIPLWTHPAPERLRAIASDRLRAWERRPSDPDFLMIRLGLRANPRGHKSNARHAIVRSGSQPVLADLRGAGIVLLDGPLPGVRSLARAVVSQIAVLHAPGDVDLMIRTAGDPGWEWAKWLPHTHDRNGTDDAGPADADVLPMVAAEAADLAGPIDARLRIGSAADPGHLIVVLDSYAPDQDWAWSPPITALFERAGPESGITIICLLTCGAAEASDPDPLLDACEPAGERLRVRLDAGGWMWLTAGDDAADGESGVPDHCDVGLAELIARALAPLRPIIPRPVPAGRPAGSTVQEARPGIEQLLGLPRLGDFDPAMSWPRPGDDRVLQVPVGMELTGDPALLDLSQSELGGNGPHGLLTAVDNQRRHELLQVLLTCLAVTCPPRQVNLLLVGSGEDAGFAGLAELPHVAGLVTGLAGNPPLVNRLVAALDGERERRLRRPWAGPSLVVVVDDFWEIAARHPGVAGVFQRLAADGGNVGLHLLISAHRLGADWLTSLAPHLSYRICLPASSAGQSRLAIGTDDAFELPSDADLALLKTGQAAPRMFRTARAPELRKDPAGESRRRSAHPDAEADPAQLQPFGLREARPGWAPADPAPQADPGGAAMSAVIARLARASRPARQIWLPPLPSVAPLDAVLGPADNVTNRGWQTGLWPRLGSLAFPVGLVDQPARQQQEPLLLDFAALAGALAIVGAPAAGKSTLLRTLMMSAMLTHTPDEVRFCWIDGGGTGLLPPMPAAPHAHSVVGRGETAQAGRLFDQMLRLVAARERVAADLGADSWAEVLTMPDAGPARANVGAYLGLPCPVLVLIDGWAALRHELADADTLVGDLAVRGPGAGVHLVLTSDRWTDLAMLPPDTIGTRLELRLSDPGESLVSPELASGIGTAQPGRGLTPAGLLFQVLAPRMDGRYTMDGIAAAHDETLASIAANWPASSAARALQ